MLKRFSLLATALFSVWFTSTGRAQECQPQPDDWFAEVYQLVLPADLPAALRITTSIKDVAHGFLEIANAADAPLYVLPAAAQGELVSTVQPELTGEGLSGEVTPELILHVERAPALAAFVVETGASLRLDTATLRALLPYIEERNVRDLTRPGFIILPITQRGEFLLIYKEQLFTVEIAISYAINEGFAPETCGEVLAAPTSTKPLDSGLAAHTLSGVMALLLLLVSAGVVARRK